MLLSHIVRSDLARFFLPQALVALNHFALTKMDDEAADLSPESRRSRQWKAPTESLFVVQQLARQGLGPRQILATLHPRYCATISPDIPDEWIMQLLRELCEQRTRQKLAQYNTFADAVELFRKSQRILVITGAGASVSCGIPDFRSENGVYARLKKDFPELPTPAAMFDIDFFRHNPRPFYNFAREIFPGQFRPSPSHMFIKFLEEEHKLLRCYTQNIDSVERSAGIANLVECHGSFARATCLDCKHQVDAEQIRDPVFAQRVAHCPKCLTGVLKPNIVFFGEDLGDEFHQQMGIDHTQLDLLVVIGSSMQVRPVSLIPFNIGADVPQILINRQLLRTYAADIKLLGSADVILVQIALAMGGRMREKMLNDLQLRRDVPRPGEVPLPADLLARVDQLKHQHNNGGMDQEKAPEAAAAAFFPRQISVDEFKQYIGVAASSNAANNNSEHGDEQQLHEEEAENDADEWGTARKKCKMTMQEEEDGNNNGTQRQGIGDPSQQQCLWQANYALVDAHLPSTDTTLFVAPNLNVFVGAELFYDRDQDTFVHRMGIKQHKWEDDDGVERHRCCSSTSSSAGGSAVEDDDSASDYTTTSSARSLLDIRHSAAESPQLERKTESCPPTLLSDRWPKK